MRLSDIKGDRVFDVIADIIEPISNIAADETVSLLFKREKLPEGMSVKTFMLERVKKTVPTILKSYKDDIIKILSTIEGVSEDDYRASLTLAKLIQDVTELLTDKSFGELFISARGGISSGSAQENIEEAKQ